MIIQNDVDSQYVEKTIVVDGHLTASRSLDSPCFAWLVEQLGGGDIEGLRTGMLYQALVKNQ